MTARPCLGCGELIASGTHCADCRPRDTRKPRSVAHAGSDTRWRKLSLRVRKLQPWCLDCGRTTDLTADHVLPVDDYPELAYSAENLAVRCRSCNSRRGTRYTLAEATDVLNRLVSAQKRTRLAKYRRLIPVAQRAVQRQHQGGYPADQALHPLDKAQNRLHLGIIPNNGGDAA